MANNIYGNVEGITKRTMVLFFLLDTSGSMAGTKIGAVNEAINDVLPEIKEISMDNADAEIKIAVLTFSTGAKWMYPNPVPVEDLKWSYVISDGVTDMGVAFEMLNEKLSRSAFMNEAAGSYAPAIFLLTDGQPTDNYKNALSKLKENKWFQASLKAGIAIGEDADNDVIKEFTGNSETVLKVYTPEVLKKLIRFVTVTASKIGSNSGLGVSNNGEQKTKQNDFREQIQDFSTGIKDTEDGW